MAKKAKRTRAVKSPKVKGNISSKKVESAVRIVAHKLKSSASTTKSTGRRRQAAG